MSQTSPVSATLRQVLAEPTDRELHSLGYAPGSYMSRCLSCDQIVEEMDKRAIACRPCAVRRYKAFVDAIAVPDGHAQRAPDLAEVECLLKKISDLAYNEDVGEPLDDAIRYANEALALMHDYAQSSRDQRSIRLEGMASAFNEVADYLQEQKLYAYAEHIRKRAVSLSSTDRGDK